ncbi:MAG: type II toxin-antitoxin system HicA family toxin [Desulfitobacteriaceae bacterium]|nr:type II toxin-antitoxin system HicA family toxin [Desulfitobacteriaceae bacterium]MDI6879411.1 type II toxin-antitoxin system HicA family toxin [Desulfitobacteriaceae bacterium]MDI6914926.1 type II toxin-antitoxin system HicA family toxin [Desulfitobacteriaceae bacterium]
MTRMPRVSGKDVLAALKRAGFIEVRTVGSHRYLSHKDDPTRWATVAYHGKETLSLQVLSTILQTAKLSIDEFIELL